MQHLNRNILCALAIKTTGPDAQKHELIEIIIIPLTPTCDINKKILPFNVLFKPEHVTRAEFNLDNDLVLSAMSNGFDKYDAADIFEKWFAKLDLPPNKRIMVLTHDWAAKSEFIKEWLQPTAFRMTFSHEYRDIQAIGLFLNDYCDLRNERWPFPKVKLSYMSAVQKIEYANRLPTVVDECQAMINLYKSLLRESF